LRAGFSRNREAWV